MKKTLGIYIHIPFCVQKCRYCDFCSFPINGKSDTVASYCDRICKELSEKSACAAEYTVDTVYFGGGTPSLLPLGEAERILRRVFDGYHVERGAEITFECNPATADEDYFRALRALGVNRLSMGLQSSSDRELVLLGRIHSASDFTKTYLEARRADFDNISADLMYGIPDQTLDSLRDSLKFLCELSPEHISAYGLTVEEGTYFHRHESELRLADGDGQYEMYRLCSDYLRENGYNKYEISNFAKEGRESRHNLRYWRGEEYLGFGVAAHSFFRGQRYGNSRDMEAFLRGEDILSEVYEISETEALEEYVMLGLRLREGISLAEYRARSGRDLLSAVPRLQSFINDGLMRLEGDRLSFTDRGFFVSNAIISELIT